MKKAFLLSIAYTLGSIALSLAFKALLTSLYEKSELAIFFTAVDMVSLFMLFFIGFRASMSVSYAKNKTLAADVLNGFRIAVAVMCVVGFFVSAFALSKLFFNPSLPYLAALFAGAGAYAYFSNQLSMYRLYDMVNVATILEPLFVFIWFLALFYPLSIRSLDALYLSSALGGLSLAGYIFFAKNRLYKEPLFALPKLTDEFRLFLKNSAFGGVEFLFGILILYLATAFIGYALPIEALGDFQVVVKSVFMYFVAIFVFPIVKFMLPELSALVSAKEIKSIKKLNRFAALYALGSALLVCFLTLLFAKPAISALFGAEYIDSAPSLFILSSALFFVILNTYQVALLKAMDRFFLSMSVRGCGTAFFAVWATICYEASPTLEGVCAALTLSYASMSALSFYLSTRELKRGLLNPLISKSD